MTMQSFFSVAVVSALALLSCLDSHASNQLENSQDKSLSSERLKISNQTRLSPKILKDCQTMIRAFALCPQEADALCEHLKAVDHKEPIVISDPYALALGLWQVHQETKRQRKAGQVPLSPEVLINFILRTKLSSLSISWDKMKKATSLIHRNHHLTQLELFKCGATDQDIDSLMFFPYLCNLSLEENRITDQGALILSKHPHLTSLKLWKNNIGPEGARALSQNTVLRDLGLYKNQVGDEGASYLSQNTTLTHLDLRANGISDSGAQALAGSRSITSLQLRYNQITDKGAESFLTNIYIVELDLGRNQTSKPDLVNFLETPRKDTLEYFQTINLE